jgi:transcription elongation factor Elf1
MIPQQAMFPCPICGVATDVRITKKDKPYVTCDPCGVQLFVRGPAGICAFNCLVARGESVMQTLSEMEKRYRLNCDGCGTSFWAEPQFVRTSAFDGRLKGFRCPKCDEVVPWNKEE